MKKLLLLASVLSGVGLLGGCDVVEETPEVSQSYLDNILDTLVVRETTKEDFYLLTSYEDITITWTSNNSAIIINDSIAEVDTSESQTVTLTATITVDGITSTKSFDVIIVKVPSTYMVTFEDVEVLYSYEVDSNDLAESYLTSKEGYTFIGWYLGEELYDFTTAVTSDITLVAKWESTEVFFVTFICDGISQVVFVNHNKTVSAPSIFESYNIEGWYIGDESYDFNTAVLTNLTLTAKLNVPLFNGEATASYAPIYNADDLKVLFESLNGLDESYAFSSSVLIELKNDIYLDSDEVNNISYLSSRFSGTLNGNGYTISGLNLQYTGESGELFFGLFSELSYDSVVKGVKFDNAYIYNVNESTASNIGTGVLAGIARGIIEDVVITNSSIITMDDTDSRVGALVGRIGINNLSNEPYINNIAVIDTTITGGKYVGGIAGHADYTSTIDFEFIISNCYVSGVSLSGYQYVGGLAGYCRVSVHTSVTSNLTINISGSQTANGSLCGYVQNSSAERKQVSLSSLVTYSDYKNAIASESTSNGSLSIDGVYCVGYDVTFATNINVISYEDIQTYGFSLEYWSVVNGELSLDISRQSDIYE